MTDRWQPMTSAPRDGTMLEVRHVSRAHGEIIFRTRWLKPAKAWIDWDRQHVALDKTPLRGWRVAETQYRHWTAEEEGLLAQIHCGPDVTYLDPIAFQQGVRKPVPAPGMSQ